MKPKILFFVLPYVVTDIDANRPKIRSFFAFPYGLLSVVTYIKDIAEIKIVDLNYGEGIPHHIVLEECIHFEPDIVGFTMMFDNSYKHLYKCCAMAKKARPDALVILGGAAASYSAEEILSEQPYLDAICYSEGEIPMLWLIKAWQSGGAHKFLNEYPSWITRETLKRKSVPEVTFIQDLDQVIDIDYSFVDVKAYDMQEAFSPFASHHGKHNQYFVVTGRGCPFKCTFCSNAKIHGNKMRFASVDKIIDHVDYLHGIHHMDVLTIYDDQLLIDKRRAKDLFRRLEKFNIRIEMPNGLSPAFVDEELAELMHYAGVDTVYLAIEHGNETILKDVIRKPLNLNQVEPAVEALHAANIFVHGFFVIGMPGETHQHRIETVERIKEWELDWAGLNPATPVRGSVLYDMCIKNGWIKRQSISDVVDKKYIINAPELGLTPEFIEYELDWMNKDVNFHHNRRVKIGDYKTAAACFQEVLKRYPGHSLARFYLDLCNNLLGQ
jgi:radical SAM superfamily enzyme YgiQ (UPF0313 family)